MTRSVPLHLGLDYTHGLGDRTAFLDALACGQALAARCPACGRCWFPPRPRCPGDGSETVAEELAGTGTVRAETQTETTLPFSATAAAQRFVLVALDGATGLTLGRMLDPHVPVAGETRVRLAADPETRLHPAQHLTFELDT